MKLEKERFRKVLGLALIVMLAYVQSNTCQIHCYWQKATCYYTHWIADLGNEAKQSNDQTLTRTVVRFIF